MRLNPEERFDVEQAMNHHWMKENTVLTPPDTPISALTNEATPSSTPIDSQDMSPPPVNHSFAKKNNFNPVFWSIRKNMSATLTWSSISESEADSHHQPSQQAEGAAQPLKTDLPSSSSRSVVDEIDEFSSDEERKPRELSRQPSSQSRSRSKYPALRVV
jgi:hypothetical protein